MVSVTSLWADERVYWLVGYEPYMPAHRFEHGNAASGLGAQLPSAESRCFASRCDGCDYEPNTSVAVMSATACSTSLMR